MYVRQCKWTLLPHPTPPHPVNPMKDIETCKTLVRFSTRRHKHAHRITYIIYVYIHNYFNIYISPLQPWILEAAACWLHLECHGRWMAPTAPDSWTKVATSARTTEINRAHGRSTSGCGWWFKHQKWWLNQQPWWFNQNKTRDVTMLKWRSDLMGIIIR